VVTQGRYTLSVVFFGKDPLGVNGWYADNGTARGCKAMRYSVTRSASSFGRSRFVVRARYLKSLYERSNEKGSYLPRLLNWPDLRRA
jgi:hypothetical protein